MTNYCFYLQLESGGNGCSGLLHLWVRDASGGNCIVPTKYSVRSEEWNALTEELVIEGAMPFRKPTLRRYINSMKRERQLLEKIVGKLENAGMQYTSADIASAYLLYSMGSVKVAVDSMNRGYCWHNRHAGPITLSEMAIATGPTASAETAAS